ncbi:hypothetical protein F4801DRAFT_603548 [Xylaria longipes]|nr:hypothetical protein F4801DRAFT_603548 [Xylaria longipes]
MSDQDRGRDKRPRDQDHGRNKRHRDQSSDTENRNESIVARRNRNNQNQTIESLATIQRLSATYTVEDPNGNQKSYPSIPINIGYKEAAAATINNLADNTIVLWSSMSVRRPIDPIRAPRTARIASLRQERERNLERSLSRGVGRIDQPAPSQDPSVCKICDGQHHTAECIYLNMNDTFDQTTRAFRYWCPFHKRPHPMDDCRQLHVWASNPETVRRLLITESADAPAFATDLISWPDLVRDTDRELPWSADYSHKKWKDNMMRWAYEQLRGPVKSHRGPDPATTRLDRLDRLPYQTASGNAPRFQGPSALEQLAAFAKGHEERLDQENSRNRELAGKARIAELNREAERMNQRHKKEAAELHRNIAVEMAEIQQRLDQGKAELLRRIKAEEESERNTAEVKTEAI